MPTKTIRFLTVFGIVSTGAGRAHGDLSVFNSDTPADNVATRAAWLAAANVSTPSNLIDFESGFIDGDNVSGVTGLFTGGLVIMDTGPGAPEAIIRSGPGVINGSNTVGTFALTHDEAAFLELDFSSNPIDYVAFQDIDHTGTTGVVTFEGGATAAIAFETTASSGNSAEFFGIFRNDMPRITLLQLDASGDARWGIDTIEFGTLTSACLGDVNDDGTVDVDDLVQLILLWGDCPDDGGACLGDFDRDGARRSGDLQVIVDHWGPCP